MLKVSGYTVIDVETTGLFPEMHDRIVEIGVVYLSHDGQIQDHWTTLVNPERDVGPTRIHGITPSDVVGAPTFAELAPYVLRAVSGRIVVAHNADFDLRFLAHELQELAEGEAVEIDGAAGSLGHDGSLVGIQRSTYPTARWRRVVKLSCATRTRWALTRI